VIRTSRLEREERENAENGTGWKWKDPKPMSLQGISSRLNSKLLFNISPHISASINRFPIRGAVLPCWVILEIDCEAIRRWLLSHIFRYVSYFSMKMERIYKLI
jgi:hypothetical protein